MPDEEQAPFIHADYDEHPYFHNLPFHSPTTITLRQQTKRYLTSKTGHYSVLLLVSLDVSAIFADFLTEILACKDQISDDAADKTQKVLGIVSLVFSCLFMLELISSVWAYGWSYFNSRFHCFDATIIVAGFIVDVILKGVLEELGSLVVVLRLWRVFKIIEELSAGAQERVEPLHEQIEGLQEENDGLRKEVAELRKRQPVDRER